MNGNRAYDLLIRAVAVIFVVIGAAILVITVANGGGPISTGVLIGLAFIGIGVARYVIQVKIVKGGR